MAKTEAERRANKKYAQTPKGKEALMKAHKKRADTEEYRAYQREKQKEYQKRRKLEARGEQEVVGGKSYPQPQTAEKRRKLEARGEQEVETPINTEVVVPTEKVLRLPTIKVVPEVDEILRSLPNRSEYIRDAVIRQLREDGLLQPDQDSGSRGAA